MEVQLPPEAPSTLYLPCMLGGSELISTLYLTVTLDKLLVPSSLSVCIVVLQSVGRLKSHMTLVTGKGPVVPSSLGLNLLNSIYCILSTHPHPLSSSHLREC